MSNEEPVSALSLINLASDWLDYFTAVEAYCPPDEGDGWPDFGEDLIRNRNDTEERLLKLLRQADAYGIDIDL